MKNDKIHEELALLASEMSNAIYSDIKSTSEYRLMLKMDLVNSTSIICAMIDDICKYNNVVASKLIYAIYETFKDLENERSR